MITIHYTITQACQRAELIAGRSAHQERTVNVVATPALAEIATLYKDGDARITAQDAFDHVLAPDTASADVLAQIEKRRAEEHLENEKTITAALTAPDEAWFGEESQGRVVGVHRRPRLRENPLGIHLTVEIARDPRIVAHRARLAEVIQPRIEAWEQRRDAADAREEAAKAAKEAAAAARKGLVKAFVLARVPEYRRAAEDGRDVQAVGEKAARKIVYQAITTAAGVSGLAAIETWYGCEDRDVPTNFAYTIADQLCTLAESTIAALPPELRALVGEPTVTIDRLDTAPDGMPEVYVTAAVVEVPVAGGVTRVGVRAEDAATSSADE